VETDRNLLFGVLALQLGFIDRDAFAAAGQAWAARRELTLADILVSQGFLTAEDRAAVEQRMTGPGDAQEYVIETTDPVGRGTDDAGPARSQAPTVPQRGPAPAVGVAPSDAARYTRLRVAGTGGVGRVWLARDASLGRDVALKELRPDRADPGFWGRFLREAQVTGQLEHPAIVPVYDVCRRPQDGQPFYTMRFVRGRTLTDAADAYHARLKRRDAGTLELRELLGAFVQVCNAIGYAHSRGVLHRDLKPHNVVLGDFGEVMVLDWGLAKVMSDSPAAAGKEPEAAVPAVPPGATPGGAGDPTQVGAVLGTPAYMSPEQAEGRHDLIDVRTDVHGLGAILYQVLTGTAPFGGRETARVLDRVRHHPPPRPRTLAAATPPAMEAICLKALARRREDRYPTAEALAEDVRRFLADEPVTAFHDPLTVRLARWGRRHRAAVAAAAALLLTATVALAVGLVAVRAEQTRTAQAARETREALERSRLAEQSAGEQRQLALKTVRGVVDDIQGRLKDRPAQQELRKALLGRALAGLTEVARAADTAEVIDRTTVRVHAELGDIFLEIEEGGSAEGRRQYEKAHELALQVAGADPQSAETRRELAASHDRLGDMSLRTGDSRAALGHYQQARDIRTELPDLRDRYVSHNKVGDISLRLGDSRAARESYRQAVDVAQRLADARGNSAPAQRDLSVAHNKLGDADLELGDSKAARDSYTKALGLRQRLADADKESPQGQRDLAVAHSKLGDAQLRLEDNKAALESYRTCHIIHTRLAEADRTSARAQRDLAVSDLKLGDAQRALGDHKAALRSYEKALTTVRRLAGADASSAQAQRDLSIALTHRGDLSLDMGDAPAALDDYTGARELRERLAEADASDAQAQRDLCLSYAKLGTAAQQAYDFEAALGWYGRAIDVAKRHARPDFFKRAVADVEQRVRFCRAATEAVADPATVLGQPDRVRRPILVAAISALATREKQPARASAAAALLADIAREPGDLYNAACGYALCVPLADNAQTREGYAARAFDLLRQAVAKGFRDLAQMQNDPDLNALRGRDEFKKLLADLGAATKPKAP
jgi:serine/threonine-protein kinase